MSAVERFSGAEMAALVGLVSNLEDDPDSDDICDRVIRRCRDIAQRARGKDTNVSERSSQ